MTVVGEVDFKGTERFAIEHRLGAGGMGVVYRAYDNERKTPVALKTLKNFDAQALYRFKNEFRALADIQHPNLIGLGELICDDGTWFFTMDLVDGQDFLAFVRPDQEPAARAAEATPSSDTVQVAASSADDTVDAAAVAGAVATRPRFDEARLRAALAELALGVSALHAAGKVHRDIKPSNVMVTRAGKVVLLDFGLITDLLAGRESLSGQIVGTPAYMAPEQAAGGAVGPAADWYSVGMVLYEALTGGLPFRGTIFEIITAKQRSEPPPPSAIASGVPADLDALCRELLRIDPKARPDGREVLKRLGARAGGDASAKVGETSDAMRRTSTFVGRERELAALRDAFDVSRRGAPVTVFVHGESGLGKSELVRHFVDGLEGERAGALVLSGRCYERESVPYKAFDGIVDALSRHLCRIDPIDAALLLPRDASLLVQVFPVLRRVPAIERLPASRLEGMDPLSVRTRAFLALRELLSKLVERRPLVLGIDDFQWADADSQALLREALRPPGAPALLLLSTTRNEGQPEIEGDVRRIDLAPLSPEETHALVHLLSESGATDPAAIAREAGGHPLFIQELVRHAPVAGEHAPARLDDVLRARVGRLDAEARGLLEVVAVAGAPIAQEAVARAAGLDLAASARCVSVLRAENLVRTSGTHGQDAVEPYHDRVRESVLAHLDEQTRRERHRGIAGALEGSGAAAVDPNAILRHLEACGETARAAKQAEQAARLATEGLAFDRAAGMYATAIRLGQPDGENGRRLRLAMADALANAGRSADAAETYLAAAEGAEADRALDCRQRAAEFFLSSGSLARGIGVLESVLAAVGERFPATGPGAVLSLLWQQLRLRLRGVAPNVGRGEIALADRLRLDAYMGIATIAFNDPIRALDFTIRALLLALRVGAVPYIVRSLAIVAGWRSGTWGRSAEAQALLARAQALAEEVDDPGLKPFLVFAHAALMYHRGLFREALADASDVEERSRRILRRSFVGVAGGIAATRMLRLNSLHYLGRFRELERAMGEYIRDAARRGERFTDRTVSRGFNAYWLATDDPAGTRARLGGDLGQRTRKRSMLSQFFEATARAELGLYWGEVAGALDRLRREAGLLARIVLRFVVPDLHRCDYVWLCGRLALAEADGLSGSPRLLRAAVGAARRLERGQVVYADIWARLLRSGVAFAQRDRTSATGLLREAVREADSAGLQHCAAAARRRLGGLLGGSEGSALISQADAWYASEGVKNPERFTDMLAPGFRRPGALVAAARGA